MTRGVLAALFGVAALLTAGPPCDAVDPAIVLPVASKSRDDNGRTPDYRLVVNLTAKGEIRLSDRIAMDIGDPERRIAVLKPVLDSCPLAYCAGTLSSANLTYDLVRQKDGKRGFESLPGGTSASRLFVLLRADKDAPWQHVLWLMKVFADGGLYKVQIATKRVPDRTYESAEARSLGYERQDRPAPKGAVLEAVIDAYLPESALNSRVSDNTVGRRSVLVAWPAKQRSREHGPIYICDGKKVEDLRGVSSFLKGAATDAGGAIDAEIRAAASVPFKYVVAVLDRFHSAGVRTIRFWSPEDERGAVEGERLQDLVPSKEVSWLPRLPAPKRDFR